MIEYAAKDVHVLLPLYEVLKAKIGEADLTYVAEIEHRTLPAVVWMSSAGVPIDAAVRRVAQRLRLATGQAKELARRIRSLARRDFEPLTHLCGIDLLTAGALAGILGPPTSRRFSNDAQLAAYAGVAPLE